MKGYELAKEMNLSWVEMNTVATGIGINVRHNQNLTDRQAERIRQATYDVDQKKQMSEIEKIIEDKPLVIEPPEVQAQEDSGKADPLVLLAEAAAAIRAIDPDRTSEDLCHALNCIEKSATGLTKDGLKALRK